MRLTYLKDFIVFFCFLILTILSIFFYEDSKNERYYGDTYVVIEEHSSYDIVYHSKTHVMYSVSRGYENEGVFTILLNSDGSPMIYEGD